MKIVDKNGVEIKPGQVVLTDEAGWRGDVVINDDPEEYGEFEPFCLLGDNEMGGFSFDVDWSKCEVIRTLTKEEIANRWYTEGEPDPLFSKLRSHRSPSG
jgi:hypothetical protein